MISPMAAAEREFFGPESGLARAVRLAMTLLLCADFTLEYIAERSFLPLDAYAAGRVLTPYQYRVLPMLLMRPLDHVVALQRLGARMPEPDHSANLLVMAGLAFFGMLLAVYATRATIVHFTGDRSLARWFSLLVVVMSFFTLCPTWGLNYSLPYDVPSLALFAVGLWLVVSGRTAWLFLLMVVATLNRETSLFLVLFYLVYAWVDGRPRAAVARNAAGLLAVWVAMKVAVGYAFRTNPAENAGSGLFIHHVGQNLRALIEPQQWPVLLSVCGFTLPVLALGWGWLRHRAYGTALLATLALWFAGMMIVGVLVEIRIFAEWAALVTPALALMVSHRWLPRTAASPATEVAP